MQFYIELSLCDYDNCSMFNSYSTHFKMYYLPFLQPCGSCHLPSYQLWLFSDSAGHDAICADRQTDTARTKAEEYHALLSISNLIEKTALIIDNCDHPLQFYMLFFKSLGCFCSKKLLLFYFEIAMIVDLRRVIFCITLNVWDQTVNHAPW